jgi:hypothetical protein
MTTDGCSSGGYEGIELVTVENWALAGGFVAAWRFRAAGLVWWPHVGELVKEAVEVAAWVIGVRSDDHDSGLIG